jgi:single-stranded-DNA-specific exonuclease
MWKQKEFNKEQELNMSQKGMHGILARLISQRNIETESAESFLKADYNDLSHPYKLHDVEKAVNIFIEVAKNKGAVSVIGDFDADGVISSTMLKELCNNFGLQCNVFLPSRIDHGYGLNQKTIKAFSESLKKTPDLLIITDCGMNNSNQIDELRALGIKKIIVIDHHEGSGDNISLNADALVTWHLSENYNEMCACGEVFQFIRGIRWLTKKVNPIEFLTLAAIGTVADVSPIIGDNRIIVRQGLTEYSINHVAGAGLKALLKQSNIHITALTQEDIAFKIAPKINAVGRMFHPDSVYHMLVERNVNSAENLAEHITKYNEERKLVQSQIEKEAKSSITQSDNLHGILTYNKNWHIGVVGIVASKIAETYNCPALVVGYKDGVWKGSGRSINGIHIKQILDMCPEIFDGYGGHSGAVGFTLNEEKMDRAPSIFNDACEKYFKTHKIENKSLKLFDAHLKPQSITKEVGEEIIKLSPYCNVNNPEPIFKISKVNIVESKFIEKETWRLLKFKVEKDGFIVPYSFKTFSPPCGSEIEGRLANIFFSFPQKMEDPSNRFFEYELSVVDIELI